jgi:mono/diheme cytochrome c family protein
MTGTAARDRARGAHVRWQLAVALATGWFAAGCTGKYVRPTTSQKVSPTPELLDRGGYLVNQVAACGVCHTPRIASSWLEGERTDAFLAGGQIIDDAAAGFRVVVPNITPDPETGIGAWTDDEIMRGVRDGVRANGELMMPPMPFSSYGRMADSDARAVVAYLRTVTPLRNGVDRGVNTFPLMFSFAKSAGLIHHQPAKNVALPPAGDPIKRGEYLARAVASCWECHSITSRGPSDKNLFAGSEQPFQLPGVGKVYARNLTPDPETGLGRYTASQIKQSLRTGKRLDGKPMAPPMSSFIPHFSGMAEPDLDAIVAYLQSIPARKQKVPERVLEPAATRAIGETGP